MTPELILLDQRRATLEALITRIEALRWPDPPEWGVRELERDIAVGAGLFEHRRCGIDPQYRPVGQSRWLLPGNEPIPHYLRSLDAAMTLALPGWSREAFCRPTARYCRVDVFGPDAGALPYAGTRQATEPVATTVAWLLARLA